MVSRDCLIYLLLDPETYQIRYVGQTARCAHQRWLEHVAPSRCVEASHKTHWIESLRKQGLRPVLFFLEYVADPGLLDDAEKRVIAELRSLGCRLTNCGVGGDSPRGHKWTPEQRARASEAQKMRFQRPEERLAAAAKTIKYVADHPEQRRVLSARATMRASKKTAEQKILENQRRSTSLIAYYSSNPEAVEALRQKRLENWSGARGDARRQRIRDRVAQKRS